MSQIVRVQGENFKRIKAIDVPVNGNTMIEISGKNGQGKTSVIDLIWWVLNNPGKSKIPQPIRNGEDFANGVVELNDMIVTRTKTYEKDELEVVPKSTGIPTRKPATILSRLVGENLDPMEFLSLKESDQVNMLMNVMGLKNQLDKLDEERKLMYEERTLVNRELKTAKAKLPTIPPKEVSDVDVTKLIAERDEMQYQIREKEHKGELLDDYREDLKLVESEIKELENKLSDSKMKRERLTSEGIKIKKEFEALPNIDTTEITEKINNSQEINRKADEYKAYKANKAEAKELEAETEELTTKIGGVDLRKQELIKSAKFPVDGLGFSDGMVMLNGAPLKQAGDAEQIKVCIAIAAATIPEDGIRVMRIKNGSLLDSENKKALEEMAEKLNFQPWVETVDESGKTGVVIEDGQVKVNNYEKQLEPELN